MFAVAFCGLASMFANRVVVFLFFALCFSESVLNGLFHVGATALSGVYCPGLITALVLYPPLFWYLSQVAYREGLLTNTLGVVAFLIAVVIHTVDVATSVSVKAPITSPHNLMLRNLPRSHARRRSADPITPRQHAKIGSRRIGQHRYELQ